jgi:hypothetical protein
MAHPSMAPARSGTWRWWVQRLALVGISLLFSFLVVEGYVRATWRSQWEIPKDAVRAPGIFSFRMKPDHESDISTMDGTIFHVVTNARGFRGPLVSAIARDPLKVIFLGDSFTFGWGVALEEHGLWRFMDRYRSMHPDRTVGDAWVACGSWDPRDYYYAYLTEAAEIRPDLVVVGVFTGNDVLPPDTPRVLDPGQVPYVDKLPETPRPWFRSIDWMRAELSGIPLVARIRAKQAPAAYAVFDKDPDAQRRLWDTSFFYLKALDTAVKERGGRLVIVLYPSMLQVNTPDALASAGYDPDMPERTVGQFAKDQHITLITLLDALRAKNNARDLYFPKDRHLTAAGQAVGGEVFDRQLGPIVDALWLGKTRGGA